MTKNYEAEKSESLIKLMGWERKWVDMKSMAFVDLNGLGIGYRLMHPSEPLPNLYCDMNLAWLVVRFVDSEFRNGEDWMDGFFTWWENIELYRLNNPHHLWLDKIYELAKKNGRL